MTSMCLVNGADFKNVFEIEVSLSESPTAGRAGPPVGAVVVADVDAVDEGRDARSMQATRPSSTASTSATTTASTGGPARPAVGLSDSDTSISKTFLKSAFKTE